MIAPRQTIFRAGRVGHGMLVLVMVAAADRAPERVRADAESGWIVVLGDRSAPGTFLPPAGVALDADGNVYVADTGNHRIQKLSPDGQPLAQWGSFGTAPGRLNFPDGVAVDADGNVYVTDTGYRRVQKLSPRVILLATWGSEGSEAGQFRVPHGIAIDADGRIFVADTENGRIQQLSPSTDAFNVWNAANTARLRRPFGVAVNRAGTVYVADADLPAGCSSLTTPSIGGEPRPCRGDARAACLLQPGPTERRVVENQGWSA